MALERTVHSSSSWLTKGPGLRGFGTVALFRLPFNGFETSGQALPFCWVPGLVVTGS